MDNRTCSPLPVVSECVRKNWSSGTPKRFAIAELLGDTHKWTYCAPCEQVRAIKAEFCAAVSESKAHSRPRSASSVTIGCLSQSWAQSQSAANDSWWKSGDLALAIGGKSVGNPILARASRAVVGSVTSSTNVKLPSNILAAAL
jgi:hypothetical protein